MIEFENVEAAVKAMKNFLKTGDVVLLKASRASRLERIAETLKSEKCCESEMNALLFEPTFVGLGARDGLGKPALVPAAVPLHHGAQRGRGDHGAAVELVARAENHPLAQELKFGQDYKDKAEEAGGLAARVLSKKGTPTMGGILIVTVLVFSTMLWAQWNAQVELTLLSVLVLAGLGFYDDYAKIIQQSGGGTPPRVKLLVQIALGIVRRHLSVETSGDERIAVAGKKIVIVMHSNLVSD